MWKNKKKALSILVLLLLVALVFFVCSHNSEVTGHDTQDGNTEKKATEGIAK